MGGSSYTLVNMNALIVIGLCALGANAQFISSGVLPYTSYAPNLLHSAAFTPITYATHPFPAPIMSKFHAQDELGQHNFGYFGGPSSRNEVRDAFGIVRGSFSHIDANGELQHQNYVADGLGFRVAATNLPVAPEPEYIADSPDVAAAKAILQKAHDDHNAAVAAAAAETPARKKRDVGSIAIHSGFNPTYYGAIAPNYYGAFAPSYYSAAPITAARDATLLRIENNPGHAVSYRVY